METTITKTTKVTLTTRFTITLTLTTIALLAPIIGGHQQWITGPIVNATLFLATMFTSTSEAYLVGMFPSTIALGVGLLPAILAPIIPFIIISNATLVTVFSSLRKTNAYLAVLAASFTKYAFLALTSTVVTRLILNEKAAQAALKMLTWPQFATALLGGAIALSLHHAISKEK